MRQPGARSAAVASGVGHGDRAAVQFDHPAGDGQAQAGAAVAAAPRSPRVKRSKTGRPLVGAGCRGRRRSPRSPRRRRSARARDQHRARRAGCAGRRCRAGSPAPGAAGSGRRAAARARRVRHGEADVAAGAGRGDLRLANGLAEEGRHVARRPVQRYGARVQPGQVEQLGHQPAEPLGLARARCASVAGLGLRRPRRRCSPAAPCSAVIGVRSSCDTLAISSRRCRSAAARSAAIELNALGQLADLVAGGGPHPPAVVAAGHRPGGGGHLPQRRGHAVRQHLRGQQRDGDRGDRRVPGDPADAQRRTRPMPASPEETSSRPSLILIERTGSSGRGSRSSARFSRPGDRCAVTGAPPARSRRRARCGSGRRRACAATP